MAIMPKFKRPNKKEVVTAAERKKNPEFFESVIHVAKNARTDEENLWVDCERMYRSGTIVKGWGNDTAEGQNGLDRRVIANLIKEGVDNIVASTVVDNPVFEAHPAVPEDAGPAQIAERYANEIWRRYGFQPEYKDACLDSVIIGHGWLRTNWRQEMKKVRPETERYVAEAQALGAETLDFQLRNPELAHTLPDAADIVPSVMEAVEEEVGQRPVDVPVLSHPYIQHISPYDMFVDPTATKLENARWIAQRVIKNTDAIRSDSQRYNRNRSKVEVSDLKDIQGRYRRMPGGMVPNLGKRSGSDGMTGDPPRQTILWEMWSLEYEEFCVWPDSADFYLVAPGNFPMAEHPYIYMPQYKMPNAFYPAGIIQQAMRSQEALSEGLTAMLNHRRRSNATWLVRGPAFKQEAREALMNSQPHGVVEVDADIGQASLDEIIKPLQQNPIPSDYLVMDNSLRDDIKNAMALDDIIAEAPSTRRSATEASIAETRHSARAASIRKIHEDAAIEVTRRSIANAQEWLFVPEPLGAIRKGKVDLDDDQVATFKNLASEREFRFDIRIGNMDPDVAKQHEVTLMMQQLAPFMQMGIVNPREIVLEFLRAYGIEDPERLLVQQQQGPPGMGPGGMPEMPALEAGPPNPNPTGPMQELSVV